MLDFLVIATRSGKRGIIEIYPKFIIKKSSDLMIRGGDFYAIWIEERGLWSTDEQDAVDLIDRELDRYAEENCKRFDDNYRVMHMWDAETGMIDTWQINVMLNHNDGNIPTERLNHLQHHFPFLCRKSCCRLVK